MDSQDKAPPGVEENAPRPMLGWLALLLLLTAWSTTLGRRRTAGDPTEWLSLSFLVLALCWLWVEYRTHLSGLRRWIPCAVTVLSSVCVFLATRQSHLTVIAWDGPESIRQPPNLDRGRCYLSVYQLEDLDESKGMELQFGNVPMYSGIQFVQGYSPMGLRGMVDVFSFYHWGVMSEERARNLLTPGSGLWNLLEVAAVDGLIVTKRLAKHYAALEGNGWRAVAPVEGGWIFHRVEAPTPHLRCVEAAEILTDRAALLERLLTHSGSKGPHLLLGQDPGAGDRSLHFAPAPLDIVSETRARVEVRVAGEPRESDALVVFARAWYPGYRATFNGEPLPVELFNLVLPAVRVPPGDGTLVLEYRPRSLILGCWLAGVALLLIAVLCLAPRKWPRPS